LASFDAEVFFELAFFIVDVPIIQLFRQDSCVTSYPDVEVY